MKITAERFKALLDGTATDVSGEERVIRIEAFSAERRGEDPATAVQARIPSALIVETPRVRMPLSAPAASTRSSAASSTPLKHRLWWFAFIGIAVAVVCFAASVGMGSLVAHFIGVAIFALCMQGLVWFFRAPMDRS